MPVFPWGVRTRTYNVVPETRATLTLGPYLYATIPSERYPTSRVTLGYLGYPV